MNKALRFSVCALVALVAAFFTSRDGGAENARIGAAAVENAIRQLEEAADEAIDRNVVPGMAIAVVFEDKLVFAKGFGVRDTGTGEPVDADTVFQLASLSKPIASTVVAALIGDGKITWDSKISDLDPGFEMFDPWVTREITVRDFFAHRSGLPEHAGDLLEDLGYSREEVLYRLRYQRPNTSFRSGYAYTNFGLTEAAVAAAKASGLDWADASEQKLYKPLGMQSSSSRFVDFDKRPNKALGHVLVDGKWVQKYRRDPEAQSPAGGVSSSVTDVSKWLRLQLANGRFEGRQVVPEAPLGETHLPQILTSASTPSGMPGFYGLGWNIGWTADGRLRLSHSGAFDLGAGTTVNLSPTDQLGVVVLTNGAPLGVAEGLAANFMDTAIYGAPRHDWMKLYRHGFEQMKKAEEGLDYSRPPVSPSSPAALVAYVGTYTNDFFGDIEIIEQEGGLAIIEGPKRMIFPMRHYDRDVFTYVTAGEMATGTSGVLFTLGREGTATEMIVENLNIHGQGTFTRK